MYGRYKELKELLQSVAEDDQTLFGIEGVTGIGKTVLCKEFAANVPDSNSITVDLAHYPTEDALISALFMEMKRYPITDTAAKFEEACKRVLQSLPELTKKLLGAAIKDMAAYGDDKLENVAGVLGDVISDVSLSSSLEAELEKTDSSNKRLFIKNFMELLGALDHKFAIFFDNFQSAEPAAEKFIQHVINHKPEGWALCIACNTETPSEKWNTQIAPFIPVKGGKVFKLEGFDEEGIREWYSEEVGSEPAEELVQHILNISQGGRAVIISTYINDIRLGKPPSKALQNYEALICLKRNSLSKDARKLGELIAPIKLDASIPKAWVEQAALKYGIETFSTALEELVQERIVTCTNDKIQFYHATTQKSWKEQIADGELTSIKDIWFEVLKEMGGLSTANSDHLTLLPFLTPTILTDSNENELMALTDRLEQIGAQAEILEIHEASWSGGVGMQQRPVEHALKAAQMQLDLGRYDKVEEALLFIEREVDKLNELKHDALLLRMKLSLRINKYPLIWRVADLLDDDTVNSDIKIQCELIKNTAYRDLLVVDKIEESIHRLCDYEKEEENSAAGKINRALARSLAKLGNDEEAITRSKKSIEDAINKGSLRDIGNAHLALGESLRYARNFIEARNAYKYAEDLTEGISNRDSLLWSKLGLACLYIEHGKYSDADCELKEIGQLLEEPGYDHPIETAHYNLLYTTLSQLSEENCGGEDADILQKRYDTLGIDWPKQFMSEVAESRELKKSIPI